MQVHFVMDRPASAQQVHARLQALQGETSSQSQSPAAARVSVHVGEWACAAPMLRARAMAKGGGIDLLSEYALAEAMGVASLELVLDGIAWR